MDEKYKGSEQEQVDLYYQAEARKNFPFPRRTKRTKLVQRPPQTSLEQQAEAFFAMGRISKRQLAVIKEGVRRGYR